MPVFDGRQIAAARALANIGIKELAEAARVTVGRLESDGAISVDKIIAVLRQRWGVELRITSPGRAVRRTPTELLHCRRCPPCAKNCRHVVTSATPSHCNAARPKDAV